MADFKHRREDDPDLSVVSHLRATDTVISGAQRWMNVIVVLICFGVQIGVTFAKFSSMEGSIVDLRNDVNAYKKQTSDSVEALKLDLGLAKKDIQILGRENVELRGEIAAMRAAEPPEVRRLREEILKLQNNVESAAGEKNAINYNLSTRMAELKAKVEALERATPTAKPKE